MIQMPRSRQKSNTARYCAGSIIQPVGLEGEAINIADAPGLPIVLKLTEGQAHDGRSAVDMFDTVQAG